MNFYRNTKIISRLFHTINHNNRILLNKPTIITFRKNQYGSFTNYFTQILNYCSSTISTTTTSSTIGICPEYFINFLVTPIECLSFFKKSDDKEETDEDKLIMVIKRSILCIQREEFNKAEQLLHVALKMAQDLQDQDGITFIYDIMANLAMETEQFVKAEKLFVNVMQRLMKIGHKEDDVKMLHISSKIAHMAAIQGNYDKAEIGFTWVLGKLEEKRKDDTDNDDLLELWGLTKDCYAQLLMELDRWVEARKCFEEAYDVYLRIHGKDNQEVILLLNNLGVVCTQLNDLVAAEVFIVEAMDMLTKYPELHDSGIFQANHGLLLMKQGLLQQANEKCKLAWRLANKSKDSDGIEQSEYCLKQLEKEFGGKK